MICRQQQELRACNVSKVSSEDAVLSVHAEVRGGEDDADFPSLCLGVGFSTNSAAYVL